jgi:hypothetical protein
MQEAIARAAVQDAFDLAFENLKKKSAVFRSEISRLRI